MSQFFTWGLVLNSGRAAHCSKGDCQLSLIHRTDRVQLLALLVMMLEILCNELNWFKTHLKCSKPTTFQLVLNIFFNYLVLSTHHPQWGKAVWQVWQVLCCEHSLSRGTCVIQSEAITYTSPLFEPSNTTCREGVYRVWCFEGKVLNKKWWSIDHKKFW